MRKSPLLIVLVTVAALLGALVFYQDIYVKSAGKLSDLKYNEAVTKRSLEKYRNLVSSVPGLKKKLAEMRQYRDNMQQDFLDGQSLSIVSASLQDAVKKIIVAGGGTVSSEKTGKVEIVDKFTIVTAGFEINLPDTNALTNMLYQLEINKPSLVVKELYVRRANMKDPKALSASLTVAALAGSASKQLSGPTAGPIEVAPAGGHGI